MRPSENSQQVPVRLRERKMAKTRAAIQAHAPRLLLGQGDNDATVQHIIQDAEASESRLCRSSRSNARVALEDHHHENDGSSSPPKSWFR